jgi:gamma-glutamylputrescine oxidase
MKNLHSYWEREEWLRKPELLIVGAGIVGASIALFYKEKYPDHEVIIVDKGITPEGASTRNAGFACIGSVSEHLADLKTTAEETVLNRIERRWNGLQLLRKTLGDEEIDYHHTGGYEIFTEQEKFEKCRDKIPLLNRELEKRIGVKNVYSEKLFRGYHAIYNRVEGALNSGRLMRSIHNKLAEKGVRVWWNCRVTAVSEKSVIFDNGFQITAENIVLAVNGFISRLADVRVSPARGYVFVTKPISDLPWKGTFHFDEGFVYFRNIDDRLLLGGGRNIAADEETTDEFGVNERIKEYLIHFVNHVLKLSGSWQIDVEWSGIMGMSENKEPVIKEIEPGVWAAAGLSGMGIAIGMQVAKDLLQKMDS